MSGDASVLGETVMELHPGRSREEVIASLVAMLSHRPALLILPGLDRERSRRIRTECRVEGDRVVGRVSPPGWRPSYRFEVTVHRGPEGAVVRVMQSPDWRPYAILAGLAVLLFLAEGALGFTLVKGLPFSNYLMLILAALIAANFLIGCFFDRERCDEVLRAAVFGRRDEDTA